MRSLLRQLRRTLFPVEPPSSADCGKENTASKPSMSTFDQLFAKGLAYAMAGDHADALRHFEQAIEMDPCSSTAYCHAGTSALEAGVLDSAQDYFNLAIHYDSKCSVATLGLARVFRAAGQIDHATKLLHELTADCPERGEAWYELACCQHARSDFEHAAESLQQDLKYRPTAAPSLNLLGLILAREFGQLRQGEELVRQALRSCPGLAAALSNLGWILAEQGRLKEALDCFDQVLASLPGDEETRLMRAYANLKHGNFDAGWRDYSARHASPLAEIKGFKLPELPLQTSLVGKRVLVYAEQGLGDQIMFASCIPDILKCGGHCVLECDHRLVALFRRSFPECQVFSRSLVGMSGDFSIESGNFDGQLAMGSLPAIFRRGAEAFPSHNGYLRADPDKVLVWRKRLVDMGSGPYIGISWRGGAQSTRRQLRSIPLPQWKSVLSHPAKFISLQYGECEEDFTWAEETGFRIHHWPQAIEDYDETAALVAALDMVISVCTAVVHLGGALGKPVWVLTPAVPEWRYLSKGEQLPWYPSIRLFRQRPDADWTEVITTVAQSLNNRFPN